MYKTMESTPVVGGDFVNICLLGLSFTQAAKRKRSKRNIVLFKKLHLTDLVLHCLRESFVKWEQEQLVLFHGIFHKMFSDILN